MPNCPVCKSAEKAYMSGTDPRYGWYVLCWDHGVQTVEKSEQTGKKE